MASGIAIVGIAAELPSGAYSDRNLDYRSFFEFLLSKEEAYEPIPKERFNVQFLQGEGLGQIVTTTGAFLKDVHMFDHLEFGVTAKDARSMTLSTRKLIETTFLSLLDSGINYRGRNIGCYMAGVAHDMFSISGHVDSDVKGSFSFSPGMIANRVSYHLDLRGPSIPIDTACSSTLYATHLACQSLMLSECEAAVVGGCQINHRFTEWLAYSHGGIISRDGKCKPFDASADGFGRGEGVVVITLKPLNAALHDNDRIYATILGTAINSSGALAPVNAPVASAQRDAMLRAFTQAMRRPQEVDFIELHATGTAQGDPTEANWVGESFHRDEELIIGSVKGNVGHLEITAFLASLCKVCAMFETLLIPPNVNLRTPNPSIEWDKFHMRVPVTVESLPCRADSGRSLVAMTSSGIGGANGHCVIEGPPRESLSDTSIWQNGCNLPSLIVAGGLSPRSLADMQSSLIELSSKHDLSALDRTLGRRSRSMTWRSFAISEAGQLSRFSEPTLIPKSPPPVVFVFSGQGPQHFHMGRELYASSPVFRSILTELDGEYRNIVGKSLVETTGLFGYKTMPHSLPLDDFWPIEITLPALTMLQLALVETLSRVGVSPDVVVGHSAGETAILSASGAAPVVVSLRLAIARGKALSALEGVGGTMAALACSPGKAKRIIDDVFAELGFATLEIGCFNSADSVTLSGAVEHVQLAISKATKAGISARQLKTRVPVHSCMMKACEKEYKKLVKEAFGDRPLIFPRIQTFSTVSGAKLTAFNPDYFWDGALGPVLFADAISAIIAKHPGAIFVEIGPHPVLSGYIKASSSQDAVVICPLRRPKQPRASGDVRTFLECLGELTLSACNVDFDKICQVHGVVATPNVPLFPLLHKEIPYVSITPEITRQRQSRNGPLNYPQLKINTDTHPGLADHVIKGEPIMPAAGYLEMALEFGATKLWNVKFVSMLSLSSKQPIDVKVSLDGTHWSIRSAFPVDYSSAWPIQYNRLHAKGFLTLNNDDDVEPPPIDIDDVCSRLLPVNMKGFYDEFSSFAQYGSTFKRIKACWRGWDNCGRDEILVQIRGADDDLPEMNDYRIHPAVLDAAIHAVVHPIFSGMKDRSQYYLPSGCASFIVHKALMRRPFPKTIFTRINFCEWQPGQLTYDLIIYNEHGFPLCTMTQLTVSLHGFTSGVDKRFKLVYQQTGANIFSELSTYETHRKYAHEKHLHSPKQQEATARTADFQRIVPHHIGITLLEYFRTKELELQPEIQRLDPLRSEHLWIVASSGIDGDACLGFTRSLRREYHSWTVQAVVIDSSFTEEEKRQAIQILRSIPDIESEVMVDGSGNILVPRIIPSDPPSRRITFDAQLPWRFENSTLRQTSLCQISSIHEIIHITGVASYPGSAWAYIGELQSTRALVAGITSAPLSNYIPARQGTYIELDDTWHPLAQALAGPHVMAYVIAAIAVGTTNLVHPERLRNSSVMITHSDVSPGKQVVQLCTHLGLSVLATPSMINADAIQEKLARLSVSPTIIISASQDAYESQLFEQWIPKGGKLFLWNHPQKGLVHIVDNDPWQISDAMECALRNTPRITNTFDPPFTQTGLDSIPSEVDSEIPLFDGFKSYLLIGGVGSLGLQIAVWMYQRGAREIMLTSRSGREGLSRRKEFLAQRSLAYLESLSDLDLHIEVADAASENSMRKVLNELRNPLGGCMILTAVLDDRTFAFMTPESFEAPFTSKVDVYRTLDNIINVATLDFIIGTTSVCGLFGNAGQTNYAAANTALTGLLKRRRNSIAIVTPAIIDTGTYIHWSMNSLVAGRLRHLAAWGMTCRELCDFIEDGLVKLKNGSVEEYVPSFDWKLVCDNLGPSSMYSHLVPSGAQEVEVTRSNAVAKTVRDIVCKCLDISPDEISSDVPLTSYGLDSLTAASLSHALQPVLSVSQIQLLADLTLSDLENQENHIAQDRPVTPNVTHSSLRKDEIALRAEDLTSMVEEITADIPLCGYTYPALCHVERPDDPAKTILMTGTTGSIGAHMLAQLLISQDVRKIFVLLRKHDTIGCLDRQKNAFQLRGLNTSLLSSKNLIINECDLMQPSYGIPYHLLKEIQESITHIVHLSWPINFSAPLRSYEVSIRELRRLIDIGTLRRARLLYSSSIGIFRNLEGHNFASEDFIEDPAVVIGSGYSESKWAAEQILRIAGERGAIRPTVVRIGQMTGGVNGAWKPSEWVPSLISASVALSCVPDGVGNVSWLPVKVGAAALVDMLDSSRTVLHLRHPDPIPWSVIMSHFASVLGIKMVPWTEWFAWLDAELNRTVEDEKMRRLESAKRLLDFFRLMGRQINSTERPMEDNGATCISTATEGIAASPTLQDRNLQQLDREDVEKWVEYWRSIGHLAK